MSVAELNVRAFRRVPGRRGNTVYAALMACAELAGPLGIAARDVVRELLSRHRGSLVAIGEELCVCERSVRRLLQRMDVAVRIRVQVEGSRLGSFRSTDTRTLTETERLGLLVAQDQAQARLSYRGMTKTQIRRALGLRTAAA